MVLSMRRILILLMTVLSLQAQNKSLIRVSISGVERTEGLWRAYVVITNISTQSASVKISATVADGKGNRYPMEPWTRAPIAVAPAGMSVSTSYEGKEQRHELELPAGGATSIPAIFRLGFKIPADVKPIRLELYQGGPRSDLSNVTTLPILSQPRISIVQSLGTTVSVSKTARAMESSSSDKTTLTRGLTTALQLMDPSFASKVTEEALTDFSISTGDVWLLVALNWKNTGKTPIEIPLNDVLVIPKVPAEGTDSYSPAGMAQGGTVLLGSPFSKIMSVTPGATSSAILIYRPTLWMEEFVLQRKSSQ